MSDKDNNLLHETYLNEISFRRNVDYGDGKYRPTTNDKTKLEFDPLNPKSKGGYVQGTVYDKFINNASDFDELDNMNETLEAQNKPYRVGVDVSNELHGYGTLLIINIVEQNAKGYGQDINALKQDFLNIISSHEEQEESDNISNTLKQIKHKTFSMNLPKLNELNDDLQELSMFVSYDGNVYKLLKVFNNDSYKELGNFNDVHEMMRYIRQLQNV